MTRSQAAYRGGHMLIIHRMDQLFTGYFCVEIDVELQHVDPGLAEEAEHAAVLVGQDQFTDLIWGDAAGLGHPVHLQIGVRGRDVRDPARCRWR